MKTTTTGITRLLGYMLLAGGFLVASCTSEEQQSCGNPIDPEGESNAPNNKLMLRSVAQ